MEVGDTWAHKSCYSHILYCIVHVYGLDISVKWHDEAVVGEGGAEGGRVISPSYNPIS